MGELPADERVVVWILLSGEERTSPICENAEVLHVFAALFREDIEPVPRVLELRNMFVCKA